MCGILGFFSSTTVEADVRRAAGLLRHRGPDDEGLLHFQLPEKILWMAHTRLSIIDLSMAGHQPMQTKDGRYTIIYNGEIYNYREIRSELSALGFNFTTSTDTEVLLAAWRFWGIQSITRLIGMFAFAIYDDLQKSIVLVRDAFGIKPLFYTPFAFGQNWGFASEIPPLLALMPGPATLNTLQALDYLLSGSYDKSSQTFFQGIEQLPPGHWLEISLRDQVTCGPKPWWKPSIAERTDLSFFQASTELRDQFLHNVNLHLRSDVPIGAALSGGLDSSALVCAMRHLQPSKVIHTFSFVSPDSHSDESKWADLVNQHIGATPHKIEIIPTQLADDLSSLIKAQGEPFGSTSIYAQYRVFQAAREVGIKVIVDGQGADELLAGYHGYPYSRLRSYYDYKHYTKAMRFLLHWQSWPGRGKRRSLMAFSQSLLSDRAYTRLRRFYDVYRAPWLNRDWINRSPYSMHNLCDASMIQSSQQWGRHLSSALYDDLRGRGLSPLLRHSDRSSMHWSIESRVPFLTINLADFLLSLPEDYLLSADGETKYIFRAAMRGIVPDSILDRRDKIGFATPEQSWLKALAPQINNWMSSSCEIPFINHDQSMKMVDDMISGKRPFGWQAWRLINFCRWMQIFQPMIST